MGGVVVVLREATPPSFSSQGNVDPANVSLLLLLLALFSVLDLAPYPPYPFQERMEGGAVKVLELAVRWGED